MKKLLITTLITGTLVLGAATPAFAFHTGVDGNDGPINVIPRENLTCGRGWRFPGLIWGERPVSVCMVRTGRSNRFGGSFGF